MSVCDNKSNQEILKIKYIDVEDNYRKENNITCILRKKNLEEIKNTIKAKRSKSNGLIGILIISLIIIALELLKVFTDKKLYDLLYQISIAYVVSFIFYYITVYVPNQERKRIAAKCLKMRLLNISDIMERILKTIINNSNSITNNLENCISEIKIVDFNGDTNVVDIKSLSGNKRKVKLYEYIIPLINSVKEEVDKLMNSYLYMISNDLFILLEELNSTYIQDETFQLLAKEKFKVDFEESNYVFKDYYDICVKLKNFKEREYFE